MRLTEHVYLCGSGAMGLSARGDCHTYVVSDGREHALIDCGMARDPAALLQNLAADGLDPEGLRYVLLTHGHPDHVGGAPALREAYDLCVAASAYEAQVLEQGPIDFFGIDSDAPELAIWRDMPRFRPDRTLSGGDTLPLGDLQIEVIETPGHTKGSLGFFLNTPGRRDYFSGDTVFYQGFISILSPPFSFYEGYREGLLGLKGQKIDGLYPSHLMWTTQKGQDHVDRAIEAFEAFTLPPIKPFS